jgi:hypothetical protein
MTALDEDQHPLVELGDIQLTLGHVISFVGTVFFLLTSLMCCFCGVGKFCLAEIHDHEDDPEEHSDMPRAPTVSIEDKKRFGRRARMRLHQYVWYLLKVGWFLIGDICQAIVHLVFAGVFLLFGVVMLMPGGFGGSLIFMQTAGVVIVVTAGFVLMRLLQVLLGMHVVEPLQAVADAGHSRLLKLEKRMDSSIHSMDQVKHTIEDGMHRMMVCIDKAVEPMKHQAEHMKEVLHRQSQATEELGRHLRDSAYQLGTSAEDSLIVAAAHASRRQEIHMFRLVSAASAPGPGGPRSPSEASGGR